MRTYILYIKLLNVSVGEGTKRSTVVFELLLITVSGVLMHFGFGQMSFFP